MWEIKLKATNKQTIKANNNSQTQTTVWWLPEGRGWGIVKGKVGQIHSDGR